MPRSRSPRNKPDKYFSRRENVKRRSRSPRRSPRRKSRSHSPRRHSVQKRRSPSPMRRKPHPDRRPSDGRMVGQRRSSPPPTQRRGDIRHPPDRRRKPSGGDRTRDRTPSPAPMGLAHMDHEESRRREISSRDRRGNIGMSGDRESPGRYRRSHSFSPPRKPIPISRSPPPPPVQTATFIRPSRSPDRPGPPMRQGINTITMVTPAVRRPLLSERFREEDQIGPLRIDDNITIGIHRSGSHFKSSRKNVPVKREFDPHCFIMVRKRDEGQKMLFDREEIHEFERMMAEESERRMISIVPSDDYHRTVSSAGSKSDKRGDIRHVKQSAEPKVRLDPKPDPRYEKLYKASRQKEEMEHKRMEKVQHNPNDLRHNLLKRRHDDDDDDSDGFDARKKIEAKRKDSSKLRAGHRERRSSSRTRSDDRGHHSADRKRSIDDRLGKSRSGDSESLPDFKNRPDKYKFEDWKQKPEMIPKNSYYYEHDNREDDRSFMGRGRGRFQRFRGTFRGNYRGRGFSSSSYRPRGRGFTSSYKGFDRNSSSSNYERIGRKEPYSRSRNSTGDTWKHDLYDKLEKDDEGTGSKKERHDDKTREEKVRKSDDKKEIVADHEKVDDNKPSSTT